MTAEMIPALELEPGFAGALNLAERDSANAMERGLVPVIAQEWRSGDADARLRLAEAVRRHPREGELQLQLIRRIAC